MRGSRTASIGPARCSSNMSRPAGSAARRVAVSTTIAGKSRSRPGELQYSSGILLTQGEFVIKPSQSRAIPARERLLAGRVFRDGKSGQLPGFGAERGFSAAELFSAFTMVVAGCDQGGIARTGQHHRSLRRLRTQPFAGNATAERRLSEGIRAGRPPPGVHPVQRLPARSVYLPVLRRALSLA